MPNETQKVIFALAIQKLDMRTFGVRLHQVICPARCEFAIDRLIFDMNLAA